MSSLSLNSNCKVALALLSLILFTPLATLQAQPVAENSTVSLPVRQADVMVSMRDGIEISLEIFTPDTQTALPTLYAAGPYLHGELSASSSIPGVGPIDALIAKGYNIVLASVRGSGKSSGEFDFLGREEQQDHYEIIEWIANQPFSDGQIAGLGAEYYAAAQWQMAIQNPPHLTCIAPINGITDPYRDWAWHGGVAGSEILRWYEEDVRDAHAYPNTSPPRYIPFDLKLQLLQHPVPDEWWTIRAASNSLSLIQVPAFSIGTWDNGVQHWESVLNQLDQLGVNSKIFISNSPVQGFSRANSLLLEFYDWCFTGQNANGYALAPKVRFEARNMEQLRASTGWPPANINYTSLFLNRVNSNEPARHVLQAPPVLNAASSLYGADVDTTELLSFESLPVSQDFDLAGPILLELYLSSTGTDTALTAELFIEEQQTQFQSTSFALPTLLKPELPPQAELLTATSLIPISSGVLKASNRQLTTPAGSTMAPEYNYTQSLALVPASTYRLDVVMTPGASRIRTGSRLVLKIRQANDPSLHQRERTDTLHYSKTFSSRLWLPLAADARLVFDEEPSTEIITAGDQLIDDSDIFSSMNPIIMVREQQAVTSTSEPAQETSFSPTETEAISSEAKPAEESIIFSRPGTPTTARAEHSSAPSQITREMSMEDDKELDERQTARSGEKMYLDAAAGTNSEIP